MSETSLFELPFTGFYDLGASIALARPAGFLSDHDSGEARADTDLLHMAMLVEDDWSTVGVTITQTAGQLSCAVSANSGRIPWQSVQEQVIRVLSLDLDGIAFEKLGAKDPVVAILQTELPSVRPVLFASPYIAAARAIIGHRLSVRQANAQFARLSQAHGVAVTLDDRIHYGFPAPATLSTLPPVSGLALRKVEQLRALGAAAKEGWLDSHRLRSMDRGACLAHLQRLAGIGPFSADLILIRGVGDPDAFPETELGLQRAMASVYALENSATYDDFERIAERWRPFRSLVGFLLRHHGARPLSPV